MTGCCRRAQDAEAGWDGSGEKTYIVCAVYVFFCAIDAGNGGILQDDRNLLVFCKENLRGNFTGWIQSFPRIVL